MQASLLHHNKRVLLDGSIEEIVIWKLPEQTVGQSHGFKYRLYFGLADGTCLVKYDNHKGKRNHKHLQDNEEPYVFASISKLLQDFFADVHKIKGSTL